MLEASGAGPNSPLSLVRWAAAAAAVSRRTRGPARLPLDRQGDGGGAYWGLGAGVGCGEVKRDGRRDKGERNRGCTAAAGSRGQWSRLGCATRTRENAAARSSQGAGIATQRPGPARQPRRGSSAGSGARRRFARTASLACALGSLESPAGRRPLLPLTGPPSRTSARRAVRPRPAGRSLCRPRRCLAPPTRSHRGVSARASPLASEGGGFRPDGGSAGRAAAVPSCGPPGRSGGDSEAVPGRRQRCPPGPPCHRLLNCANCPRDKRGRAQRAAQIRRRRGMRPLVWASSSRDAGRLVGECCQLVPGSIESRIRIIWATRSVRPPPVRPGVLVAPNSWPRAPPPPGTRRPPSAETLVAGTPLRYFNNIIMMIL